MNAPFTNSLQKPLPDSVSNVVKSATRLVIKNEGSTVVALLFTQSEDSFDLQLFRNCLRLGANYDVIVRHIKMVTVINESNEDLTTLLNREDLLFTSDLPEGAFYSASAVGKDTL